jgi:hypothetical protein
MKPPANNLAEHSDKFLERFERASRIEIFLIKASAVPRTQPTKTNMAATHFINYNCLLAKLSEFAEKNARVKCCVVFKYFFFLTKLAKFLLKCRLANVCTRHISEDYIHTY